MLNEKVLKYKFVFVFCFFSIVQCSIKALLGPQGFWGAGEKGYFFRELGSTANYFRGAGEQAHTFWDLGSTAKK